MLIQPSGRPPGVSHAVRLPRQHTSNRNHSLTFPYQAARRANNRQSQHQRNKPYKTKKQRVQCNRAVNHRAAPSKTVGHCAISISDEHKKEFQPVHKIWMTLQPTHDWHIHQKMMRQQHKHSCKDTTRKILLLNVNTKPQAQQSRPLHQQESRHGQ